jgi:hypothetical protein
MRKVKIRASTNINLLKINFDENDQNQHALVEDHLSWFQLFFAQTSKIHYSANFFST